MLTRKLILSAINILLFNSVIAQTILSEDFATGIPGNWTQNGAAAWTYSSAFGNGCAIADRSGNATAANGWLQAPGVNLANITNPFISFKVASIRNNSAAPDISLWYSNGGNWQMLTSWGTGQGATAITQTQDATPPLDASNVTWVTVTYDLSAVANNTNIRFSFGADFTNGGWLLLDSVRIYSAQRTVYPLPYTQDFEQSQFLPADWERFGANNNADWQRSNAIGGYGNSNASAYFDNFTNNVGGAFYGMRAVWLDLTSATKPTLSFDYAYAKRSGVQSDRLGVWYMTNSVGWTNLNNYEDATLTTATDKSILFVPTSQEWQTKTIDLTQFASQNEIRFAFECNSRNGNVMYIDNVRFYDDAATSIAHKATSDDVQLYPNPAQDVIYIELTNTNATNIQVYDVMGRSVANIQYAQASKQIILNTTSLSNGMYYLHVSSENSFVNKRFIINR